jgi:fatty-acyl-CoA synthase
MAKAAAGGGTWFAAPPLMHAASQWTAFAGLHSGATIVLHDDAAPFDARSILETIARERVNFISIVGDAFARRLIEEMRTRSYDLASLHTIATGGAVTSEACKEALLELLPQITIVDGYGASETGGMAYGARGGARPVHATGGAAVSRRIEVASSRRATTRPAGRRGGGPCRSATSATGRRPRRPSRSSTASVSPSPAIGPVSGRTASSPCSGATPWS